jgi:hypothetical protein
MFARTSHIFNLAGPVLFNETLARFLVPEQGAGRRAIPARSGCEAIHSVNVCF